MKLPAATNFTQNSLHYLPADGIIIFILQPVVIFIAGIKSLDDLPIGLSDGGWVFGVYLYTTLEKLN